MDPLTDDRRIDRLTRDLGDLDLAERLVGARRQTLRPAPDDVAGRHLSAILAAASEGPGGQQATRDRRSRSAPRRWRRAQARP